MSVTMQIISAATMVLTAGLVAFIVEKVKRK
jgi:hypothetical protein